MSEWKAKRFWTAAEAVPEGGGFTVALDARPIRTPHKSPLILPSHALAAAVAGEWDAQTGTIDPRTMPLTRLANSAIDKVAPQFAAVAGMLAAYGETDLLCHRADAPEDLVHRQAAAWDPLLDWAALAHGARLTPTTGVLPAAQPQEALDRLAEILDATSPFELTAIHEFVTLSGSLVIGIAQFHGIETPDALWAKSRIDEEYQIEQWGRDEEADAANQLRYRAFLDAARFLDLTRGVPEAPKA